MARTVREFDGRISSQELTQEIVRDLEQSTKSLLSMFSSFDRKLGRHCRSGVRRPHGLPARARRRQDQVIPWVIWRDL